jgi:thiol:disulfide interchange protein
MMRVLLLAFISATLGLGQTSHVNWTLEFTPAAAKPGAKVTAKLTAKVDEGWHLYSISTPPPPIPTTIKLAENPVFTVARVLQGKPIRKHDPNFDADTETFEGEAVFYLDLSVKAQAPGGPVQITAQPRYQVCSATSCIPPKTKDVAAQFTVDPAAAAAAGAIPAGYSEAKPASGIAGADQSIWAFLAIAFGFGLAAIFTPCVFPMIPITMSFFLNQKDATRRQTLTQAGLFCLGIVVLFAGLGLVTTSLLGPFGVVQLGSNPWVNGLICAIFLVFGLSLLGAFEITIPSSILTKLDRASQGGGVIGTLLMGLTFSLASFACVGPFVGTLLAASAQGGGARPALGMLAFAIGLALPFFLLALFPAYLKKLPRSGGWLARVKVVMGFVVLAAMLKYLASIDQVLRWNLLTRERFLAAWIVLFAMAGLYLLGFVRLEGVEKDEPVSLGRLLTGMAFVIFAITLAPGMSGAKLGELDAYVPVAEDADLTLWMKDDLAGALAKAKAEGKRVLVNFTGYACTNCHWMKANMFTRPEIAGLLKDLVLVDLYTDGTDAPSQENQKLEESKFGTIAIPFYVIYDGDRNVLATFPELTRDPQKFAAFLSTKGLQPVASAVPTGSAFDALPLTTLSGAPFDRSALKGKPVVVDFWATWCVPCRQEIPAFNKLSAGGVAVIGVSMDEEGATVVTPFLKEHPMTYPVALGAQSINDTMPIAQLPTTVIFDGSGKAVQRFEGLTEAAKIEAAVKDLR